MAIYVKEMRNGSTAAGDDFTLFADAATELTGAALTTENNGAITCEPGSKAYTADNKVMFLNSSDTWVDMTA